MKAVHSPTQFITGQSLGANFSSSALNVIQADVVSLQLNYTGSSPTGTLVIQGSLDGVNYAAIPFQSGSSVVTSLSLPSATSPILVNLTNLNIAYLQVAYTYTSGSGDMEGWASYKRIGD